MAGLVRMPEVAVTRALAWLASRDHVADGLAALVKRSGLNVESESQWFAEVRAEDGTRTDLECVHVESSAPVVVVEAKLTAAMTSDQLRHYAAGQRRRLLAAGWDRGVLAVLVPVHRRDEAEQKLVHALAVPGDTDHDTVGDGVMLRGVVWTFDELLEAISPDGSEDPDVTQLADLVAVQEALDIRPFSEHELVRPDGPRRRDLWVIADRVSAAIAPGESRLPPSGEDAGFEWRRYVELTPRGTNVAIGVRRHVGEDPPDEWTSLLWLRVHRVTPNADVAAQRLARHYPNTTSDIHGHTWLALDVPAGAGGADVVDAVRTQVEKVAAVILEAEPD